MECGFNTCRHVSSLLWFHSSQIVCQFGSIVDDLFSVDRCYQMLPFPFTFLQVHQNRLYWLSCKARILCLEKKINWQQAAAKKSQFVKVTKLQRFYNPAPNQFKRSNIYSNDVIKTQYWCNQILK